MVITEEMKEVILINGLVSDMGLAEDKTSVFCDRQSIIHLTKN